MKAVLKLAVSFILMGAFLSMCLGSGIHYNAVKLREVVGESSLVVQAEYLGEGKAEQSSSKSSSDSIEWYLLKAISKY